MISVAAAQDIVLPLVTPLPASVGPPRLGRVLAEPVAADRDLPPFPKAMMDGFAVRASDCVTAGTSLCVVAEITAGAVPDRPLSAGEAARIMTGAALPEGADAVVMIEHCTMAADRVTIGTAVQPGQHVQPVGAEMQAGVIVVPAKTQLSPVAVGLLAAVGRTEVTTYPAATLAVINTGDEIVEPDEAPRREQIRNSNGPMLVALGKTAGATTNYLGIARDDPGQLLELIETGLAADVLVLSGGVSVGTRDLVPEVLKQAGVDAHFHKVAMKPGKPLFFGTRGKSLVFGLPGNPVSSLVGFELFVRPALRRLMGVEPALPVFVPMPLAGRHTARGDRPTYFPARITVTEQGLTVQPVAWGGSPDLKALLAADALALFPAGDATYEAGTMVNVYRLPGSQS